MNEKLSMTFHFWWWHFTFDLLRVHAVPVFLKYDADVSTILPNPEHESGLIDVAFMTS